MSNLDLNLTEEQKSKAQELIRKHFSVVCLELIGQGQEGIVYSDGAKAYKCFFESDLKNKKGLLDLIQDRLKPTAGLKRIITIEKIIKEGNQILLSMPLIEGNHYSGGRITEILELIRECKNSAIVTTNLSPKNLVVGKDGLVYVDIGRSIAPFDEDLFNEMCKRAYLTYRWHFRSDLRELLTRSLKNPNIPELFGYDEFKKVIEKADLQTQFDSFLIKECLKSEPQNVLHFGCVSDTIADQLAIYDSKLHCYDPCLERFSSQSNRENSALLLDDLDKRITDGLSYDLVLCDLVLGSIESDTDVEAIIQRLRALTSQNGQAIIKLCNPLSDEVKTTPNKTRNVTIHNRYHDHYAITENTHKGSQRTDWHRPISWYKHVAHKAGFELQETFEVPSVDIERVSPSSDQIMLKLHPLIKLKQAKTVSLMIKASAMEWQTIEKQVRHIVSQLEGPQQFIEKIVVTDTATEGYSRQYAKANMKKFQQALKRLLDDHVIDRVISAPNDSEEIKKVYCRWFSLECFNPRASNGQPIYMTLFGLNQCKGDYVLQMDCDCIVFRRSRAYDYLGQMISIFKNDASTVTIALPIPCSEPQPFRRMSGSIPFRVEVRCCLLNISKLKSLLPLENEVQNGQLNLPWHRSLDKAILQGRATSYRGGDAQTCFVHVPNIRKVDINDWMNILDVAETGRIIPEQLNKIELTGEAADWLGKRNEEMVILMRGRNVALSKVRRCIASLQAQSFKNWSAIIIDANSSNGLEELYDVAFRKGLEQKVTYFRNYVPMTPMENIDYATRSLCINPQSIIVHLDLDDALIGTDALSKVKEAYDKGADLTVGSMLRTDKQKEYQVTVRNPRANRGGNVWQHLRTYRKYIYDAVPKEYFKVDGEWVKHSEDWAFMIPIVELAKNPVEIKDKIYFYEPSEDKSQRAVQDREQLIAKIMAKPSLEGLNMKSPYF